MCIDKITAEEVARNIVEYYGGRWRGARGTCRCPAHDDRNPSLSVCIGREGRPLWKCHTGCSQESVRKVLQADGLLDGRMVPVDAARLAALREQEEREATAKGDQAYRAWNESRPISGTLAEDYLRRRGISCALPPTLAFHPNLWHFGAQAALPAMVAVVEGVPASDGIHVRSTHFTFLDPAGDGKAEVDPDKMMRGKTLGGAVRLADAGPDSWLVVAEGIETALSLACGLLPVPATIWAALNTAGMANLILPKQRMRGLMIAADFDPINPKTGKRPGTAAAEALAARAREAGWVVRIMYPEKGIKDFNDVLVQKARSAAEVADPSKGAKVNGIHEFEGDPK